MTYATRSIVLRSARRYGKHAPPEAVGRILSSLPHVIRLSVRMAFEGRSSGPGRPRWLEAASDIRLVDYAGQEDTVLSFEAPLLKDAVEDLCWQDLSPLWPTNPRPDDTGLDVLGDVVWDIAQRDRDSMRFDPVLLKRIADLRRGFNSDFQEIRIPRRQQTSENPAVIDERLSAAARQLLSITPAPQRVRVVGKLSALRAGTRSFALELDDGRTIRGVLVGEAGESLNTLVGEDILVLGRAIYRPSGLLLRLDADPVRRSESESAIWRHLPEPPEGALHPAELRKPQAPRSGVAAIIGKWPGDESDEEIREWLKAIS